MARSVSVRPQLEDGELTDAGAGYNSEMPPALAINIKDVVDPASPVIIRVAKYTLLWKHLDAHASPSETAAHVLGAW